MTDDLTKAIAELRRDGPVDEQNSPSYRSRMGTPWLSGDRAMTTALAAWLRKLRDEGPQRWVGQLHQSAWEQCFDAGWADFQIGDDIDFITPAGLAAIDEHERGKP